MKGNTPKVLALSSGGGHWVQLLRLGPAFEGADLTFATVRPGYQNEVDGAAFEVIPDANRWSKIDMLKCAWGTFRLLLRLKPDVVISTGAAPGFFAVRIASLMGIRTVWVDSIANGEELSLSGRKAGSFVDLWVTQWEHLAKPKGPHYFGNVLGDPAAETPGQSEPASTSSSP